MSAYSLAPNFLNGPSGRLFCLCYEPEIDTDRTSTAIIHIPAFIEEMNKSRRMVSLQARKFAEAGHAVYLLDLYGTGDSEGELEEVTWETWQQDVVFLCDYLQAQGKSEVWLWGLRGGGLLAADQLSHPGVAGAILWQPLLNGQQMVSQLNRLQRIVIGNQGNIEDSSQGDGQKEISGYIFNPQLLNQLPTISLKESVNPDKKPILLIDVSVMIENSSKDKINNLVEALQSQGGIVLATTVAGDPFWLTQEVVLAPDVLAETCRLFEQQQAE